MSTEKGPKKLANLCKAELFLFILMDKVEQSEAGLKACQGKATGHHRAAMLAGTRRWNGERVGTEGDWLKPFTWNSWMGFPPLWNGPIKGVICLRLGGCSGYGPPPLTLAYGQPIHPFPILQPKMNPAHQYAPPISLSFIRTQFLWGRRKLVLRGNLTLTLAHFISEMSEWQWPNADCQKISITKEKKSNNQKPRVKQI